MLIDIEIHEKLDNVHKLIKELEKFMAVKFDGLNTSVTNLEAVQVDILAEIATLKDNGSGDQAAADALAGRVDSVTNALRAEVPVTPPPVEPPVNG